MPELNLPVAIVVAMLVIKELVKLVSSAWNRRNGHRGGNPGHGELWAELNRARDDRKQIFEQLQRHGERLATLEAVSKRWDER